MNESDNYLYTRVNKCHFVFIISGMYIYIYYAINEIIINIPIKIEYKTITTTNSSTFCYKLNGISMLRAVL